MTYFNLVGANGSNMSSIRVYQRNKFSMIQEGKSYTFKNLINKGESHWLVSCSSVGFCGRVNVDQEVLTKQVTLPEDQPVAGMKRTLSAALESPEKSTVIGKISQVSPVKNCRDNTLAVRTIAIKDESGKVAKVALFQENAEMEFPPEKIVQITAVYKKKFNDKPQLTATSSTVCQFLPSESLDVTITEDDKLDDDDFKVEDDASPNTLYTIDTVMDAAIYSSCSSQGCRKKMKDGKCPTCSGLDSILTCRVKVVLEEAGKGKQEDITLFEKDLRKLFTLSPMSSNDNLITELCNQLPINFTAKFDKGRLYNITHI